MENDIEILPEKFDIPIKSTSYRDELKEHDIYLQAPFDTISRPFGTNKPYRVQIKGEVKTDDRSED